MPTATASENPPMLAFHASAAIREKYLNRVLAHKQADEIISGKYWENGKGCAVGCTVHSDRHDAFETELGIPRILARLEDRLFEALYSTDPVLAKEWPLRFLSAISPGANLAMIWPQFAHWLLMDKTDGVIKFAKTESRRAAIGNVGALYQRWLDGSKPPTSEWESARRSAAAAADAAAAAAAAAAYAAYADAAADAAAYAAAYAAAAARRKHYVRMADKLIEFLEAAK